MKYEDEQFEGLLSDSLKELREAQPRTGLEGRVLAGVRAAGRERRFGWWSWAAVAAMVMLIVLGIAVRRGSKTDVVEIKPARTVPETPKKLPEPEDAEKRKILPLGSAPKSVAVKKKVLNTDERKVAASASTKTPIPAPAPLSEQEKALILLARNNPEVLRSVKEDREQQTENQEIAPIEIHPIKISGIGDKEQ